MLQKKNDQTHDRARNRQAVAKYYGKFGTRLGYKLVMRKSQHFGYYETADVSEEVAQANFNERIAALLGVEPGMKVLDAGCGQGVMAVHIAALTGAHVTGVTIVPHEIGSSRKLAKRHGVADLTDFRLADYSEDIFPAETFDRIYAIETLSHAADVPKVMANLYSFLKPGGTLLCVEYELDKGQLSSQQAEVARHVFERAGLHALLNDSFGPGVFQKTLEKVGFTDIEVQDWTQAMKPSFDRLRRLAQPGLKVLKALKVEKRFTNTLAASLYSDGVENNAFWLKVYRAKKPR